jgi:hypothetical protein
MTQVDWGLDRIALHLRRRRFFPVLFLAVFLIGISPLGAQGLLVDQQWNPPGGADFYISFGTSTQYSGLSSIVGQEFRPTMDTLNGAELFLGSTTGPTGPATPLVLRVRIGSITGAVIGASDPFVLLPWTTTTAKFEFPDAVALRPGDPYVLELQTASPDAHLFVLGSSRGGYPSGDMIIGTTRVPNADFFFREGVILDRKQWLQEMMIPEPRPTSLGLLAVIVFGLARFAPCRNAMGPRLNISDDRRSR